MSTRASSVLSRVTAALWLGWSALCLGMQLASPAKAASDTAASDSAAITQLFTGFGDAFNRHDARQSASFCAVDVDYIVGDGSDVKGRAAVEAHLLPLFADRLRAMNRAATLRTLRFLSPDVAVVVGDYQTSGAIAPDRTPAPTTTGIYDWVVVKRAGRWEISVWHEANLPSTVATPPH